MHRALLALWVLASCTPTTSEPTAEPAQPQSTAGQIYGVMQTHEGLTLQIDSGGCRQAGDVTFSAAAGELTITDVTIDSCEAYIVLGETLLFPWAELPTFSKLRLTIDPAPVIEPGRTAGALEAPAGENDEEIYGVLVTPDGLDVRVQSGGCTTADSFTSWIEPGAAELVHLVRSELDGCDAYLPDGVLLHFTWQQLGVTRGSARLVNPIVTLPVR
jgi:hypothetical protein